MRAVYFNLPHDVVTHLADAGLCSPLFQEGAEINACFEIDEYEGQLRGALYAGQYAEMTIRNTSYQVDIDQHNGESNIVDTIANIPGRYLSRSDIAPLVARLAGEGVDIESAVASVTKRVVLRRSGVCIRLEVHPRRGSTTGCCLYFMFGDTEYIPVDADKE